MTDQELIDAARQAAQHSYSPYSKFPVGAALRFADGSIVTGTNIENASYGLALCAETVAVSKAMADGEKAILKDLVDCQGKKMDIGGYYFPYPEKTAAVMRPSKTFNAALGNG